MLPAPHHRTTAEIEQRLDDVLASPQREGILEAIFVRPRKNERHALTAVAVTPDGGIEGDRWAYDHWQRLDDGRPDPNSQVTLMNVRMLKIVAVDKEAMCLAGDNLIVDLDLSEENLPVGSHLEIGDHVVLEITAESHTGCGAFARRYGLQAREFVNSPRWKPLHLRGRYGRVIHGGTIQVGDTVRKINA